jgi:hypothetical protein
MERLPYREAWSRKRIPQPTRDRALALVRQGVSPRMVAYRLGISVRSVYYIKARRR